MFNFFFNYFRVKTTLPMQDVAKSGQLIGYSSADLTFVMH